MLSPADDKELQEQLSSLEKLGFIEPSVSQFGSGVLFVPKPNGKFRLCVDYRQLNAIMGYMESRECRDRWCRSFMVMVVE